MDIIIDRDKCIGAGNCVWGAEDYFDQDDLDGKVILVRERLDLADEVRVRNSVGMCPVTAIALRQTRIHE